MNAMYKYLITETKNISDYWKFPTKADMQSDFNEYRAKEYRKWESRAKMKGFRFPIFKDFNDYVKTLKSGKVVKLTDKLWSQLPGSTHFNNLEDLKSLVHSYPWPRDIDRIIKGFKTGEKIPYPVILKGSKGYYRLSGNTRSNTAEILGIPIQVLVVDVSKRETK